QSFRDILDVFNEEWQADAEARGPFMPLKQETPNASYATEYRTPQWVGNGLIALRESYQRPTELVLITGGKVRRLRSFSSHTSSLYYNARWNRLFWSETRNDPRWGLAGTSVICYYDLNNGRTHRLTRGTRYYNPQPTPDGERLAVTEFPVEGGSYVVVLDAQSGKVLRRVAHPKGVQGSEQAWLGEDLYVSGISVGGYGLYRHSPDGAWTCVLEPSAQKVSRLAGGEDCLEWVSDRNGVNELYRFYPADGRLLQLTNTRYGATDFTVGGGRLYSVSQTLEGRPVFSTPVEALQPQEVSFADVYAYSVADKMTEQEQALGAVVNLEEEVPMSGSKRYSKLAHPLRLHSWLPFYVNYDAVKSGSMDLSYETASLGLSGYFQNTLGTFSGMIGYSLHPDPDVQGHWRNALHVRAVYTGWYPVIEANLRLGDNAARQYYPRRMDDGGNISYQVASIPQNFPQVSASIRSYIPLSFSRGGRLFGFTPQVSYSVSNSPFALQPVQYSVPMRFQGLPDYYRIASQDINLKGSLSQFLAASFRTYYMAPRARSQTYPRWGIGVEGGMGLRPGLGQYYAPNVYGYAYGYVPGFTRSQGLKLTFMAQSWTKDCLLGEMYVNTLPRGFDAVDRSFVGQVFPRQWRITADYAIPIYVGDINIPVVAYIKNFLLTPHFDYTGLPYSSKNYDLWSVGADLSASLARLFVIPFDASIGVSFSYLGGTLFQYLEKSKPYSFSLIFGVDF
ncbi:MAG: hypothetical protein J6P56_03905, partial [Bacteroidales bacterium]|nr:hypothetical protein [Bacteroidales bacterium]